jgi:PAS domain S-box-containing protein
MNKSYQENLNNMMCLDIFLDALSHSERKAIQPKITPICRFVPSLLAWDMVDLPYHLQTTGAKQYCIQQLQALLGVQYSFDFIHQKSFDALVLTDTAQQILWVSDGFTKMTGYSKKYAVGKTPSFLQGAQTSTATKQHFRQQLLLNQPFKQTVLNYRRNKEVYMCEIEVFPIMNRENQTQAFLALESERR